MAENDFVAQLYVIMESAGLAPEIANKAASTQWEADDEDAFGVVKG